MGKLGLYLADLGLVLFDLALDLGLLLLEDGLSVPESFLPTDPLLGLKNQDVFQSGKLAAMIDLKTFW